MRPLRRALSRAGSLFRSQASADEDLRAELETHLGMAIEENIRRGMSPEEARRQALIAAGGLTQAAESVRAQRGLPWVEGIAQDLRFAVRHFLRTPLATVTMVLVLALGIGANVVLLTVFNSIISLPAPGIARDESLARIRGSMRLGQGMTGQPRMLSWPEVQDFAGRTDLFAAVSAYADETAIVRIGAEQSMPVRTIFTTSNYFGLLGVRPVLGTGPAADPGLPAMGASPTAVISHAMWQQRFGGAADVIGQTLRVNEFPVEIVGVAPPRFSGTDGGSGLVVWLPLSSYPVVQKRTMAAFGSPDSMFLSASARLRPGITAQMASAVVAGIAERALSRGQGSAAGAAEARGSADVVPMLAGNGQISGDRMDQIVSAATAVGFGLLALLITCMNVSALMVGLAVARRKEIGVRLSLGAPRRRLIRQLLTESVLLALIAAAIGIFVTMAGIQLAGNALRDVQLVIDWRVTIATFGVAVATGILFGLSPALHATRVSLAEVLKSSSWSVAATRSRLQRALVVAQIALTQPLLVGLGVVIVTMVADLNSRATSGVPERIVEVELETWNGRVSAAERAALISAAVERVAALPGVVAAMPLQMGTVTAPLSVHPADRIPGITYDPMMETSFAAAPAGYFGAFDIPILRGRDFDAAEYAHTVEDVARPPSFERIIIGSDLARRLWGDADPLGRRLTMPRSTGVETAPMVIVGVVDAAAAGPSETNDRFRVYVPYSAINDGVIARTSGPALPLLNTIREAVAAEAPQLPVNRAQTLAQRDADARSRLLRTSGAVAAGGLLTLLLSAIGLYAVVSFAVGQRTREIGIRTALGAQRVQVVRMFFAKGLALSAIGLVFGLPLSMIAVRFISSKVHLPLASSPLIGAAIAAVVLVVASIAAWIPARRASAIDPLVALQAE